MMSFLDAIARSDRRIGTGTGARGARVRWLGVAALVAVASLLSGPAAAQNIGTDERLVEAVEVDSTFGKYLAGRYARARGDVAAAADYYEQALSEETEKKLAGMLESFVKTFA